MYIVVKLKLELCYIDANAANLREPSPDGYTVPETMPLDQSLLALLIKNSKKFNYYAMQLLNQGQHAECQKLLGSLLGLLKKFYGTEIHRLIGLTLNNLSCSYKRKGQIKQAQRCLNKALLL